MSKPTLVTLSTHVLDLATGKPAGGIAVSLYRDGDLVANATTGEDGRIASLGENLEPGAYRLTFDALGRFFERVSLDVRVGPGHHHLPLLVSPFGIATYRGS